MVRQTSFDALMELRPEETTRKHWAILCYLSQHGMACAKKMMQAFAWQCNQSGRWAELKRLGYIEDSGQRIVFDGRRHEALILTEKGADLLAGHGVRTGQRQLF